MRHSNKTITNMNFLQVGLGSMGKRRIRNLLHYGIGNGKIFGFDPDPKKRKTAEKKYRISTFANFQTAVTKLKPDVYIISTPPNLHHKYFLFAARRKKHFFVEATTTDDGYKELTKFLRSDFIGAPSCTFRYFPAIKEIKKLIDHKVIGKVLAFTYHLGQYLPDWHPWEDYRRVYFAQKDTGGCKEMFAFELIWLIQIIGAKVKKIGGMVKKVSALAMPADDVYAAVMEFQNQVVGTVLVDVISRTPFRTLRLIGTTGIIEWEWLKYQIRVYKTKTKKWNIIKLRAGRNEKGYVTTEDMYEEEIKAFLDAVRGHSNYPYTFKEDQHVLNNLKALECSSKTNRTIKI